MRSYRETFSPGGRRRGLTQEALLERMGSVDSDYAERYSHATVSRWESGGTRPTLQRLKVFGEALNLSRIEVAGLILLAGLALDFRTAMAQVNGSDSSADVVERASPDPVSPFDVAASMANGASSILGLRPVLDFLGFCRSGCSCLAGMRCHFTAGATHGCPRRMSPSQ